MNKPTGFYAAVWIDWLHGPYAGKVALNVQECTAKGQPTETHRRHIMASRLLGDEAWIVEQVLPGAKHYLESGLL